MPRKPCFYMPGMSFHIVQRGNSSGPVFIDNEEDYAAYLEWLKETSAALRTDHGFSVMLISETWSAP